MTTIYDEVRAAGYYIGPAPSNTQHRLDDAYVVRQGNAYGRIVMRSPTRDELENRLYRNKRLLGRAVK